MCCKFMCIFWFLCTCVCCLWYNNGTCRGAIFAIFGQKLSSCSPLKKLWNVIVGCHDCYCTMHLPKFSAGQSIFKKDHYCILWLNSDHGQHRSIIKHVITAYFRTNLSTVFIVCRSCNTNVSRLTPCEISAYTLVYNILVIYKIFALYL